MELGFVVPQHIRNKMCKCVDYHYRWSNVKSIDVCSVCGLYPVWTLRNCSGCGSTFILNFYHPENCHRHALCWDCINDPLCDDLHCREHAHFLDYFYDTRIGSWIEAIRPPRFNQPVPVDISNFSFDFEVAK